MSARTYDEFIQDATLYWGGTFDYSGVKLIWKNNTTPIPITCNICGHTFSTTPRLHCSKSRHTGCKSCVMRTRKTFSFEKYLKQAKLKSGATFDFSKSNRISNTKDKINVVCWTCNHESIIRAKNLSNNNPQGCPICQRLNTKKRMSNTKQDIDNKLHELFGDKYTLVSDGCNSSTNPSSIKCNICNEIHNKRIDHVYIYGIPCKCKYKFRLTQDDFISKAIIKHKSRYTYEQVIYSGYRVPVDITCAIHGVFTRTPEHHMMGSGCHKCSISKGELLISEWLIRNNINYIPQHRYSDCKYVNPLSFDFYLPHHNICIEYNGEQHYKPTRFSGITLSVAELAFKTQQKKDSIKYTYCLVNGINLRTIPYWEMHNIDKFLNTEINKNRSHK